MTLDPSFASEGASYRQLSSRQVIAGGPVLSMRTCNTGYLVRRRRSGNITTRVVCCVTQSTITLGSQGRAKNPIAFVSTMLRFSNTVLPSRQSGIFPEVA